MKKMILSLTALFALCGEAAAQQVAVADVEALPGETVTLDMQLNADGGSYTGLEFDIQFPSAGFTTTGKATMTNTSWDGAFTIGDVGGVGIDNLARCGVLSYSDTAFPSEGLQPFGTVEFTVGSGIALGDYTVTLTNITLIGDDRVPVADVSFTLSVVSTHSVLLDEESTVAPSAAEGVNVRVKRTISADTWSTICLPFAMTAEQVKEAFGEDVQLADFTSWSSEEDDEGAIVSITVGFTDVTEMEANHPYIIKVSEKITEFVAEGVDIAPGEGPTVQVGKKSSERGYFYGTYVTTNVPEENLFIYDNKFYYSTGGTKMKAFRGYFEFRDVLDSYYDAGVASAPMINLSINDGSNTTRINVVNGEMIPADGWYDLYGRKLAEKPTKPGIYVNNGKKVVIK